MDPYQADIAALVARTDSIEARTRALKQREAALDDASKRLLIKSQELTGGSSQINMNSDINTLIADFENLLEKAKSMSLLKSSQTIDTQKKKDIQEQLKKAHEIIEKSRSEN